MAKILVADIALGASKLTSLLGEQHELVYTNSVQNALHIINSHTDLDMVIVGVHFDDSRMYELMQEIKRMTASIGLPVMGFCDTHTMMSTATRDSIETGAHLLGACDYVDTANMSDTEIRTRINTCLKEKRGIGRKRLQEDETPASKRQTGQRKKPGNS